MVATDAPCGAGSLRRIARRAIYSMAKTGTIYSNGSGDYAIAFSVFKHLQSGKDMQDEEISGSALNPLFLAVQEATVEAIYNSMFMAETTCGYKKRCVKALPLDRVEEICRRYNVLCLSRRLPVVDYTR